MRSGGISDFLRSSVIYQLFNNFGDERVFNSGCKLAVGKSAGSAFTKLNIALRIEFPALPEVLYLSRSGFDIGSPLNYERFQTFARKDKTCSESGRTEADNDGPQVAFAPVFRLFIRLFLIFFNICI